MRITSKGQVTIPQGVREEAGLMPGTDVDFVIDKGVVKVVKAKKGGKRRAEIRKAIEKIAGTADIKMSTDDLMKLLRGDPDNDSE